MKPHRIVLLAAGLVATIATCSAATVVSYLDNAFTSGEITNSNDSLAFSLADPHVTASALTKSITSDTQNGFSIATGTFYANTAAVPATEPTAPGLTFNVSIQEGYNLDLTSLSFKFGGSNSGGSSTTYTANASVYYSFNNFATAGILVSTTSNSALTLAANNVINLGYTPDMDLSSIAGLTGLTSNDSVAFRIVFTDSSGISNISLRVDDVVLNGAVSTIPEPSTYALVVGALTLGLAVVRRRRA